MALGLYFAETLRATVCRDMNGDELILASSSPRRRDLLGQVGLSFRIDRADIDESHINGEKAGDYVSRLSSEKARVVAKRHPDAVILAADTVVVLDGDIIGKPKSQSDGLDILLRLSGNIHEVLTGVAVIQSSREETFLTSSRVVFREISISEIMWYLNTGEPEDKAGAYGVQGKGAAFVSAVYGSVTNVIGLPLAETLCLLKKFGIRAMQIESSGASFARDNDYV